MNQKNKNKQQPLLRKRLINLFFSLMLLIGLIILSYPFVSDLYYRMQSSQQIVGFDKEKGKLDNKEIGERIRLAEAYNATLHNEVAEDPYDSETKKKGLVAYAHMLEIQEKIGHIEIPRIDIDIPIYAGTSEDILQKGVGHLEGTSLPIGGNSTHAVLTAHTGLPTARLFTDLTQLEIGDKFYVHNIKETLAYQVDEINVVNPSDFTKLLIVPGHDYITLLTCTPYMINTHRLLVRGHRVEYVEAVEEEFIAQNKISHVYKYLFYVSLLLIFILLYIIYRLRQRKKGNAKKLVKQEITHGS